LKTRYLESLAKGFASNSVGVFLGGGLGVLRVRQGFQEGRDEGVNHGEVFAVYKNKDRDFVRR
jgi:hypothetical protein